MGMAAGQPSGLDIPGAETWGFLENYLAPPDSRGRIIRWERRLSKRGMRSVFHEGKEEGNKMVLVPGSRK